jgi:hypothetical protein
MTHRRKKHFTLAEAHKEVNTKSDGEINRETAKKWALRALACYGNAKKTTGATRQEWLLRAADYSHEALEHAALIGDGGRSVGALEKSFDLVRKHLKAPMQHMRLVGTPFAGKRKR